MPANSKWDLIRCLKGYLSPYNNIFSCNFHFNITFKDKSRTSYWFLVLMHLLFSMFYTQPPFPTLHDLVDQVSVVEKYKLRTFSIRSFI